MKFLRVLFIASGIFIIVGLTLAIRGKEETSIERMVKEDSLTPLMKKQLLPAFKEQPPLLRFLSKELLLAVKAYSYTPEGYTPLLILSPKGASKVLWLNSEYIFWLSCSPDGRYIAYPGSAKDAKGIWVLDLTTKRAKLVAPQSRQGKTLSFSGAWFIDTQHLIVERIDEKIWKAATRVTSPNNSLKSALPEYYLSPVEGKRLGELFVLYFQNKLNVKEAEEFSRLFNKAIENMTKQMSKEEVEKAERQSQALQSVFTNPDIYILDIEKGVEELFLKGKRFIDWSRDKEWFYVRDKNNKVLKVSKENPSEEQEILPRYYQGIRIKSEEPLRFGFPYPPLISLGILHSPSSYKCYCYEKRKSEFVLLKVKECGDKIFPPDSHLSLSPLRSYSLAYSSKGLFIKDLRNGKVKKIEDKETLFREWSEDDNKLAYTIRGKGCYEVWLYDITSGKKHKLFP